MGRCLGEANLFYVILRRLWVNATQDFIDHAGGAAAVGLDDEISDFTIQRIAFLYQLFQSLARIFSAHEWPVGVAPNAPEQMVDRGAQVDDGTVCCKFGAIGRIKYGATPGGKHHVLLLHEFSQHAFFAGAKSGLAFQFKDQGNADASVPLDFMVTVVKAEMQVARELTADGGLARTHGSDQKQVAALERDGVCGHAGIFAGMGQEIKRQGAGACRCCTGKLLQAQVVFEDFGRDKDQ